MWVLDWWKRKRKKKAFRIIRTTSEVRRKEPFTLIIPTHHSMKTIQKTIVERVIKKEETKLQKLTPMHIQVIQLHIHQHIHRMQTINTHASKQNDMGKKRMRQEILRLQRIGFMEEQAYFRTRPTLARQMFTDLLLGHQPTYLRGDERRVPVHLEILKQASYSQINQSKDLPVLQQERTLIPETIPREWLHQMIKEIERRMMKEVWRKGGGKTWKK